MNKTVMLVDDSPTVRQVMRFAFEHAHYAVIEASDGQEALGALDGQKVSAIVCDIAMPTMDGLSFVKALREKRDYRFTPVVMLTTESRPQRKQEAKECGATAWATKPCPPSELVDLVNRLTV
ncbi:response regulator [Aquabacterium sp. A3]|uniref:response regulator n=1 Tax=Aquabacterium sp. A3 TaxID=3132829 RepID=UPI00311A8A3A